LGGTRLCLIAPRKPEAISPAKEQDPFCRGRRRTALYFYRGKGRGREEQSHIRKRGTFPLMHQYIIASYHAHAHARGNPKKLRKSVLFSIAKQSCRRPCAVALTSEQRSPGHWQAPLKKHAKPDGSTGVYKICQRVWR
jgi:hypothetical protein